jgi:hypothetical protein
MTAAAIHSTAPGSRPAGTEVKGTALVATVRFISERFGAAGLNRVAADLAPADGALLLAGPLVSAWYPFPLLLQVMRSAGKHFGAGQPSSVYRQMGRSSADYAVTGIYKIFFKFGSPQFIISKGSALFKTYYSSGEMRAPVCEKGHAIVEYAGFADPAPELCVRIEGWMERTLELSGGKDLRMKHDECVNRGGAVCRFEGWWV